MKSDGRRYHVLEAVGKGGFGTVYRAEMVDAGGFSKQVALKVLNPELADSDEIAERLRDEARMLGLLHHRAVVRVDGMLLLNDRWTVVMEYVDGVDLKKLLSQGAIPAGCAVEIVLEAAAGLYAAYALPAAHGQPLRVLHRDIKPSNIQLTRTGEVKVLDFGVARAEFQSRESVTRSIFFGSLNYMAPERLDGIDTHAGDVYALGAVLYELIVGEPLGRTSGNEKRHHGHIEDRLAVFADRVHNDNLVDLVQRCLAYDSAARPEAREMERLLRAMRVQLGEPWLADFAEWLVPGLVDEREVIDDDLSGTILVEQGADPVVTGDPSFGRPAKPPNTETAPRPRVRRERPRAVPYEDDDAGGGWGLPLMLGGLAAVAALVGVMLLGGGGVTAIWVALGGAEPAPEELVGELGVDTVVEVQPTEGEDLSTVTEPTETVEGTEAQPDPVEDAPPAVATEKSTPERTPSSSERSTSSNTSTSTSQDAVAAVEEPEVEDEVPVEAERAEEEPDEDEPDEDEPGADEPVETVTSTTESAASTGTPGSVFLTGDPATVRLLGGPSLIQLPGPVPPGRYTIEATFQGGTAGPAGTLEVTPGQRITLSCRSSLKRCIAR